MGKYEEALERARAGKPIDEVFPELKMSEDERIRKGIIHFILYEAGNILDEETEHAFITWLEKQKEQPMSAEEVLIRAGLKPYRDGDQWCVLAGGNIQEGICGFGDTIDEALYQFLMEVLKIQKEQKPLSTEETERNSIAFLEQLGYTCIHPGAEQKPADDKAFEEWIDNWWKYNKVNNPDSYDKGDEIQFDERGFKNFCRGIRNMYAEPKPAEWSEEDEKTIKEAIHRIEALDHYWNRPTDEKLMERLKSLRPQSHWKPSEEQIKALYTAAREAPIIKENGNYLYDLYNDLQNYFSL